MKEQLQLDTVKFIHTHNLPYISQPFMNWHTSTWTPKVISIYEGNTSEYVFVYAPSLDWVCGRKEEWRMWVCACSRSTTTLTTQKNWFSCTDSLLSACLPNVPCLIHLLHNKVFSDKNPYDFLSEANMSSHMFISAKSTATLLTIITINAILLLLE